MKIVYYNQEELKEKLCYDEEQSKIFMPNEIFEDLKDNIDITEIKRGSEHIAYAYSYVYLISYLYRYAKYAEHLYKEEELKEILQTTNNHKAYITKKGGVLDQLNYIKKESDFPIKIDYDMWYEATENPQSKPVFKMNSEMIEYFDSPNITSEISKLSKNHKINYPFRAFHAPTKYVDDEGKIIKVLNPTEFDSQGYFFDIENTHMIPVEVFMFCMSKEDLGTLGFYIYSFLKHKTDIFPRGWNCSKVNLVKLTGIKITSLNIILKKLEEYNMIYNSHEPYYLNLHLSSEIKLKACAYKAKRFDQFKTKKQEVKAREIIPINDELNDDYENHKNYSVISDHEADSLFNQM